jgi:putative Mg2+ transporter-C (MgtC) family protein
VNETYNFDFMRLMAYTIAGISFIGNGVISHNKNRVEGLTTASTLLANVVIGFLFGLGQLFYGIVSVIILLIILEFKYVRQKYTD